VWCDTQRTAFKAGRIDEERAAKLENAGFRFTLRPVRGRRVKGLDTNDGDDLTEDYDEDDETPVDSPLAT
jgi:hypothetical protein